MESALAVVTTSTKHDANRNHNVALTPVAEAVLCNVRVEVDVGLPLGVALRDPEPVGDTERGTERVPVGLLVPANGDEAGTYGWERGGGEEGSGVGKAGHGRAGRVPGMAMKDHPAPFH